MGPKLLHQAVWSVIGGAAVTAVDYVFRPHVRAPEMAALFVARIAIFFIIFAVMPYFTKRSRP
jgi:hypothetical protein